MRDLIRDAKYCSWAAHQNKC